MLISVFGGGHVPEDFQFDFAGCDLTGFDRILQGHSQGAPATDVQDLVIGLDAALLTGRRAGHHLQTVNALPFAADTAGQLDTCRGQTPTLLSLWVCFFF